MTRYIITGLTEDESRLYFTGHPRFPWSDHEPDAALVSFDVAQQNLPRRDARCLRADPRAATGRAREPAPLDDATNLTRLVQPFKRMEK